MTIGGGQMDNPGRYLVLLPPINGATAITGTPYFTENPGSLTTPTTLRRTFDYMPNQFITFRAGNGISAHRLPYWTGRGGITPPGGNNGSPANYTCSTGATPEPTYWQTLRPLVAGVSRVSGSLTFAPDNRGDGCDPG